MMLVSHMARIFLFALAFNLVGCEYESPPKTLKIGYTQEPPYSFVDESGHVRGIYPTIARKVAKQIGVNELEWVMLSFDRLIPALQNKRIDVIAAGMTVTAPRIEQNLCFTAPVTQSETGVLWRADNKRYQPQQPLESQELKFVVVDGSFEEILLSQQLSEAHYFSVEDIRLSLLALKSKRADLALMTMPALAEVAREHPERYHIKVGEGIVQKLQYSAFAFRKDNMALFNQWTSAQQSVTSQNEFTSTLKQQGVAPYTERGPRGECFTI